MVKSKESSFDLTLKENTMNGFDAIMEYLEIRTKGSKIEVQKLIDDEIPGAILLAKKVAEVMGNLDKEADHRTKDFKPDEVLESVAKIIDEFYDCNPETPPEISNKIINLVIDSIVHAEMGRSLSHL